MDDTLKNTAPVAQDEPTTAQTLPAAILDYLNSRGVLDIIYEIEKNFSIQSNNIRVIPVIISEIITGGLDPKNVVSAIKATLGATDENSAKIASIIKDKILNPIAGGLLLVAGINIEPIPGPSAKDAKDLPELVKELEPYLANLAQTPVARKTTVVTPKPAGNNLESLMVTPQKGGVEAPARLQIPGMETAGLRVMKDVKPPVVSTKPIEVKKPEPAPKTIATVRPFMLHEEKPVAPNEPAAVQMNRNFSFDVGAMPISRTPAKPVAAQLNPSSEAVLEKKKVFEPVVAKTTEQPKVVHYTSMRTPLSDETPKG